MSFSAREVARWLGQPIELYRFTRQALNWRYTNSDSSVVVGAETFTPLAVTRGSIVDSFERQKRNLTITLPIDAAVVETWAVRPPNDTVAVTLLARHRGEDEVAVLWVGRVMQPKFTDTTCELTCTPGSGPSRPRGLQLRWQRGCGVALYSQGPGMCNLLPADFAAPATLSAAAGLVVSAAAWAALPAGRLAGGYVEWTDGVGLVQRRTVTRHLGAELHLDDGAEDLAPGLAVVAYHGCAHNYEDCDSKGNGANYTGCKNLPVQNPFAGVPIWW